MRIIDLDPADQRRICQVAATLAAAFPGETQPGGWASLPHAEAEVRESFGAGHLSIIAIAADEVVGWVGGSQHYRGNTWELHPLAVRPDWQRQGVGRALVTALEDSVRAGGGRNIWLTTDDDIGATTIAGQDLYPAVLASLAALRVTNGRIRFYLDLGYTITGCIPDAYAPGHHEILFSRRLR